MEHTNGHTEDVAQETTNQQLRKKNSKAQNGRQNQVREREGGMKQLKRPNGDTSVPNVSEEDGELDLSPPQAVEEPDQEELNQKTISIRANIDQLESRVSEINLQVEKAKVVREAQNAGLKDLRAEVNDLRSRSQKLFQEKDELGEDLRKLSDKIRNQEQGAAKIRKDLKYRTEEEVDDVIKLLNQKLETSTLDLKTEKDVMRDIKKLITDKERIRELNAQLDLVKASRAAHEDLFLQRQAKATAAGALRDQEKSLQARMEDVRNGDGTAEGYNAGQRITELLDEKARLVEMLRQRRGELQEARTAFRLKEAEFREFRRAQAAFQLKLERVEARRRRAEAEARMSKVREERRAREAEKREARRREEQRMLAVARGHQLYVGGLAIRADEAGLLGHFGRFGEVLDATVVRDRETGLSRGFGFVTMAAPDAAAQAIKLSSGKEAPGLCPHHGTMQVRAASKSKAQKEFEARRAAGSRPAKDAAAGALAGSDEEGHPEGESAQEEDRPDPKLRAPRPASAAKSATKPPRDPPRTTEGLNGSRSDSATNGAKVSGGRGGREAKADGNSYGKPPASAGDVSVGEAIAVKAEANGSAD